MKRKFLALLLAFVMVAGMLPMAALADTVETPAAEATVATAKLHDTRTNGAIADDDLIKGYGVTVEDAGEDALKGGTDDKYQVNKIVTIKGTDLQWHQNGDTPETMGYWVGVAIIAPEGAKKMKVANSQTLNDEKLPDAFITRFENSSASDLNIALDEQKGYAQYFDLSQIEAKKHVYVMIQWCDEQGAALKNSSSEDIAPVIYEIKRDVTMAEPKLTLGFEWGWSEANTNASQDFTTPKTDCLDQTIWFKAADLGANTYEWAVKAGDTTIVSGNNFENGKGGYFSLLHGGQNEGTPPYFIPKEGCELTLEVTPAGKTKQTKTITVPAYTAPTLTVTPVADHKNQVTVDASTTLKGQYFVGIYAEDGTTLKAYAVTETDAAVEGNKALPVTLTADEDVDFTEGKYVVKVYACPHDVEETLPTAPTSTVVLMQTQYPAAPETFTVTFDLNGATGTAPEAQTIAKDGKATAPANPSWDGYSFGGWYKEAECTTAWDFDTDTVTADTTLYAKWTQNSTPPSSGGGGSTTTTPPVSTDKDSGTTSTTVKPSVKDETASVTVSDSTANALVNKTVKDKTDNAVIEVKPTGNKEVSEVKAEIPAKAVANLAEKTDASLTVATPVANVTIPNDALADVSKDAKTVAVTAAAKTDETSGETTYEVAVLKDGEPVNDIKGEMKVSLPVDEKTAEAGKGLVAVLVDENGNETVITKSVMTEDGQMVMSLGTGTATIKYVDNSRDYDDEIPEWAADAVQFTSSRQLFLGVSEGDFGANETMNRAMLVTVLHRLEGEPTPTKEADFADVTSDSWYAASAAWSAEMGIVAGTENGFDGNRPITRQDLALMLYRYANVYGSGKGTSTDFTHMGGAEDVADYAAEAMSWAVGSGIIVGDENNNLDPQSPTTRAQVSVMLMRFVELLAAK